MKSRIWVIIAFVALIILVVYFLYSDKKNVNWYETYAPKDEEPYGLFVTRKLLEDYFPDKDLKEVDDKLSRILVDTVGPVTANYVFVGEYQHLDSVSAVRLASFINRGGTVLIASKDLPDNLLKNIFTYQCSEHQDYIKNEQMKVQMNFVHPSLRNGTGYTYEFKVKKGIVAYNWSYLDSSVFCYDDHVPFATLGMIDNTKINFVQIKHGKGKLLLHTDPVVFTNYYMKEKAGVEYAAKVFSHLTPGDIYWDEFTKVPQRQGRRERHSPGPLSYILDQPALRSAWYLILLLAFVYLLFHAKRKQRIIPVLEPNANTSIEFTETLGRIYFQQNRHKKLAKQKKKLFLSFIRNRYQIPTAHLNAETKKKIIVKSKVEPEVVDQIFEYFDKIDNSLDISADELISMHQVIEHFYKNCK